MSTYVTLGKYTQTGIEKIKDAPRRMEHARNAYKSVGGELKDFYYTFGQYDFVAIAEAPDEEAMMKAMLIIGSSGAVKTETVPAIPVAKGLEVIKGLP